MVKQREKPTTQSRNRRISFFSDKRESLGSLFELGNGTQFIDDAMGMKIEEDLIEEQKTTLVDYFYHYDPLLNKLIQELKRKFSQDKIDLHPLNCENNEERNKEEESESGSESNVRSHPLIDRRSRVFKMRERKKFILSLYQI